MDDVLLLHCYQGKVLSGGKMRYRGIRLTQNVAVIISRAGVVFALRSYMLIVLQYITYLLAPFTRGGA